MDEAIATPHDLDLRPVLELRGVDYYYPQPVLSRLISAGAPRGIHRLNLALYPAKIYGLVGANGSGKSTIFKLLAGELKPDHGEIYMRGQPITRASQWRRARLGLGYLSQHGSLVQDLSVYLNLLMGLEAGERWGIPKENQASKSDIDGEAFVITTKTQATVRPQQTPHQIIEALSHFGALPYIQAIVKTLSGGERRRVELARILLQRPCVLILDEPFAALDQEGIQQTLDLCKIAQSWGAMILLTDHQTAYIKQVCDCVLQLTEGNVVGELSPLLQENEIKQRGVSS